MNSNNERVKAMVEGYKVRRKVIEAKK